MKKTNSLSSSLALSSLKGGTIPGMSSNVQKGANSKDDPGSQYKWDLSSTAVARTSPVKTFNERRLQRQENPTNFFYD